MGFGSSVTVTTSNFLCFWCLPLPSPGNPGLNTSIEKNCSFLISCMHTVQAARFSRIHCIVNGITELTVLIFSTVILDPSFLTSVALWMLLFIYSGPYFLITLKGVFHCYCHSDCCIFSLFLKQILYTGPISEKLFSLLPPVRPVRPSSPELTTALIKVLLEPVFPS